MGVPSVSEHVAADLREASNRLGHRRVSSARTAGVLAAVLTMAGGLVLPVSASASDGLRAAPANLMRNAGAEKTKPKPNPAGGKVSVSGWKPAKGTYFTAVAYGAPAGFPAKDSPGPSKRGGNFFAGGITGGTSSASQTVSLSRYTKLIRSGKAKFRLSAWLGGFGTQADYATLTVTWRTAKGAVLTRKTIGPVTAGQRENITCLLQRTATGKVPTRARKAVITLRMTRREGTYNDGYADNLSLTITK
ncbi:hypothetical protein [Actinocorallia longicatena]|uniref:Uncharacterized protein n=1 Tax=Actinocorallia longicatena TaxID=111803 RepID=A0ABP6PX64_9ACTN